MSDKLGSRGVASLEGLATAFYITRQDDAPVEERVAKLTQLKPHIGAGDAKAAVMEVDQIIAEAVVRS